MELFVNDINAGSLTGTTVSASTFYSGSTDLSDLFATKSEASDSPFSGNSIDGSIAPLSGTNTSSGIYSFTVGSGNTASGSYSVAEGFRTTATGNFGAHAEGRNTSADGESTHAEGRGTTALSLGTHAEGWFTRALGAFGAHAEGRNTRAAGAFGAHSEGSYTTANGNSSHSEGCYTTAVGVSSHSGGEYTIASGDTSFVQSYSSTTYSEKSAILGGTGNTLTYNANRSVILGGKDITGTEADTVYGINFNASGNIYSGGTDLSDYFSQLSSDKYDKSGGTISGDVSIAGDLEVLGTATTFNTEVVQTEDNNIDLNYSGTHISAIGGGLTLISGQTDGSPSTILSDSDGYWEVTPGFKAVGINNSFNTQVFGIQNLSGGSITDVRNSGSIALGLGAVPVSGDSVMIGRDAGTFTGSSGDTAVAIGYNSASGNGDLGNNSVSIGVNATAQEVNCVSIGAFAGDTSGTVNPNSVSIGANANGATQNVGATSIAIGNGATSSAANSIAIGWQAGRTSNTVGGAFVHIGHQNPILNVPIGSASVRVGVNSIATQQNAVAIGSHASGNSLHSVAIGTSASTDFNDSIAIGRHAAVGAAQSIMIGVNINDTPITNSVAQSVGFGWGTSSPEVLFAKTADSYISGSGNFGIGTESPISKLHVDGGVTATTVSATTFYSGSTDLSLLIGGSGDGNDITRVQGGTNISTGGTANDPVINLDDNISLNSVSASTITGETITIDSSMDTDFSLLKQEDGRVDLGYTFQNGAQLEFYHEDYAGGNPTFAGQSRLVVGGDNGSQGQTYGSFVIVGVNDDAGTAVFTVSNTGTTKLTNGTSINEFSIDGTLGGNSDDAVPTEKAVKTYVDGKMPTLSKTFTLDAPTTSDDVTIFRTDVDITVQEVIAVSVGTSPSTAYQLKHHPTRSNSGNTLTTSGTTTSTGTGDTATLSDATIPADSWIWFESTDASGTDVILSIDIRYTED